MVEGQLLGYGRLLLESKLGDYGEPRFYSGSSSSEEMDPEKEESYRIARSLRVSSDAQLACGFNFWEIGLLPGDSPATSRFAEFCNEFAAPEVERDLLGVEDSALVEAANYHLVSVSACSLFSCYYCLLFLPASFLLRKD